MAAAQPATAALKIPRGRTPSGDIDYLTLTFAELAAEAAAWQIRLTAAGVLPGDRTLLMVRPGLPLIAAAFALFALGAVPVVIDPGMGLKNFLACVARSRPRAVVGTPIARLLSRLFFRTFSSVILRVSAGDSLTARLTGHKSSIATPEFFPAESSSSDPAAILFTSGSTGAPKGVCYEHGHFDAQVRLIRDTYAIRPGEIDLPLLPIFALFNPALGVTTIIPELDPRRPAALDPAKIVQAIRQEAVTTSFGSPTLWQKIGAHCLEHKITLPTLRRVLCAGAPVPAALWTSSRSWMPGGQLHSPYGATEALPLATISSAEIAVLAPVPSAPTLTHQIPSPQNSAPFSTTPLLTPEAPPSPLGVSPLRNSHRLSGKPRFPLGACIGRPVREITLKIIVPTDAPIASLADIRELPPGEVGEIIAAGPVVTRSYDGLPAATSLAKIPNPKSTADLGASSPWHRLGDCGAFDAQGVLWFYGRKAERVETAHGTLHTEPCEQIFRAHPRATRCALIGLGERATSRQIPAIVVETTPRDAAEALVIVGELRALALASSYTANIARFFFHPKFPVDVRHNAKIHRLALTRWAATAKAYESDAHR